MFGCNGEIRREQIVSWREGPFQYPSVSRLDLLVIVLVNAGLFEPVPFVERLSGGVGHLDVEVYAVDLRRSRPSDRVNERFHHLRTYASRPIGLQSA